MTTVRMARSASRICDAKAMTAPPYGTIITLTLEAAEAMIRKAKSETRMRLVEMMRDYGMFMLDTQAPGYKVDLPQHARDAILSAFDYVRRTGN